MRNLKSRDELDKLLASEKYLIVDFTADWCGPCQMMKPVLEWVEHSYPKVEVITINIDKFQKLYKEWNVTAIPDIRLFHDGKEFGRFNEVPTIEDFRTMIRKFLGISEEGFLPGRLWGGLDAHQHRNNNVR